jgi:hypothetical protein
MKEVRKKSISKALGLIVKGTDGPDDIGHPKHLPFTLSNITDLTLCPRPFPMKESVRPSERDVGTGTTFHLHSSFKTMQRPSSASFPHAFMKNS